MAITQEIMQNEIIMQLTICTPQKMTFWWHGIVLDWTGIISEKRGKAKFLTESLIRSYCQSTSIILTNFIDCQKGTRSFMQIVMEAWKRI